MPAEVGVMLGYLSEGTCPGQWGSGYVSAGAFRGLRGSGHVRAGMHTDQRWAVDMRVQLPAADRGGL